MDDKKLLLKVNSIIDNGSYIDMSDYDLSFDDFCDFIKAKICDPERIGYIALINAYQRCWSRGTTVLHDTKLDLYQFKKQIEYIIRNNSYVDLAYAAIIDELQRKNIILFDEEEFKDIFLSILPVCDNSLCNSYVQFLNDKYNIILFSDADNVIISSYFKNNLYYWNLDSYKNYINNISISDKEKLVENIIKEKKKVKELIKKWNIYSLTNYHYTFSIEELELLYENKVITKSILLNTIKCMPLDLANFEKCKKYFKLGDVLYHGFLEFEIPDEFIIERQNAGEIIKIRNSVNDAITFITNVSENIAEKYLEDFQFRNDTFTYMMRSRNIMNSKKWLKTIKILLKRLIKTSVPSCIRKLQENGLLNINIDFEFPNGEDSVNLIKELGLFEG